MPPHLALMAFATFFYDLRDTWCMGTEWDPPLYF